MKPLPLFFAVTLLLASGAWAGEVQLPVGGGRVIKEVKSLKALRQEGVVRQQLDYSCGAAAMATLLSFFFQDEVAEAEVVGFIFIHGQTPEEGLKKYFRKKGFSLLDLKRFAKFRGYNAAGYKEMTLEDLLEFLEVERVPVLVPIKPFGYHHFVVVRGIRGSRVFLADPAVGNTTMTIARFLDIWVDGIGFVVTKRAVGKLSLGKAPSDEELAQITAAGVPSWSTPSPPPSPPPLLAIRPQEPVPDLLRMRPVLERQPLSDVPRLVQTFTDPVGGKLFTTFEAQNLDPAIQLGRPAGNFIDFSPPPGQPIQVKP